jgi:hypothetical protein
VTDGQARIKTFSLRGDELARLQEAHANGEALLQTDKTPDSDSETEAPADPNIDDKCRRAFEENGQVVSGLRGDIQGLVRMMTSGQAGPYQVPSGFAVPPPPVPFASQAPSV